jgi:hypothetical protein
MYRFLLLGLFLFLSSKALAQPDASISYVSQFGGRGSELGQFNLASDVDGDSQGRLLIMDFFNNRMQRCSYSGECEQFGPRLPTQPKWLLVDEQDRVIISEVQNHRIWICEADGSCAPRFGGLGTEPGKFNDGRAKAIDSQGRIVIADRYNDRVQFCDYEGNCTAFGSFNSGAGAVPGEFWEPASIATDGRGAVYVGELGDEVISFCDESGNCSKRMGVEGSGIGQFKTPVSLGLTSRGDLVILELSNNRIQLCDLDGACIAYGSQGTGNGQFRSPSGIHVDEQDRIIVADSDSHRIQILQITYNSPPPEPEFEINAGISDAWYNPLTNGQGFLIAVFPDRKELFLAWFTYDTQRPPDDVTALLGDPGHRWLTAQGPYDGDTASLTVYVTEGGAFDAAQPPAVTDLAGDGTIIIQFPDCTQSNGSFRTTRVYVNC